MAGCVEIVWMVGGAVFLRERMEEHSDLYIRTEGTEALPVCWEHTAEYLSITVNVPGLIDVVREL